MYKYNKLKKFVNAAIMIKHTGHLLEKQDNKPRDQGQN